MGLAMKESFLDQHRWDFCKAFLERADKSADLLRALLFAAGGAGVGFSLNQIDEDSKLHILPAAIFAIAIVVVYGSWDLQKRKARKRFELVRDEGMAAYLANEKNTASNRFLDTTAAVLLVLAVILEGYFQWTGL
jgi:hypothetical protein